MNLKLLNSQTQKELGNLLVSNYQGYNDGWKAYIDGKELKDHVLVNNWANGWIIPKDFLNGDIPNIKFFYQPQYFEYVGFGLLIFALVIIALKKNWS